MATRARAALIPLFFLAATLAVGLGSDAPVLQSKAAVMYDVETGTLLYEKNGDMEIPPASMSKLMTLHILYNEIKAGRLHRDDLIPISRNADYRSLPPRSSLMFLQEGQLVTAFDLMLGLAVPSGNDAAIAVAEYLAGSVQGFVGLMNQEARRLGLSAMRFVDASGLSRENRATAAEFARFALIYLQEHPEAVEELHSQDRYTYPLSHHIPKGQTAVLGSITQANRNNLLGRVDWMDGLKTGYIDASGYNIALTGVNNGRRLVAVLMGGPGNDHVEGGFNRALDGVSLLTYGLYRFANVAPEIELPDAVRIRKGEAAYVELARPELRRVTVLREHALALRSEVELFSPVVAPLSAGEIVGRVTIYLKGQRLTTYPLTAAEDVGEGRWYVRWADSVYLLFRRLITGR